MNWDVSVKYKPKDSVAQIADSFSQNEERNVHSLSILVIYEPLVLSWIRRLQFSYKWIVNLIITQFVL